MEKSTPSPLSPSSILIENRKAACIKGVNKVISVCPTLICLDTSSGELFVSGADFAVSSYDQKEGSFHFAGTVDSVKFDKKKEPLIKRLFS